MPANITTITGAEEIDIYLGNYAYSDFVSGGANLRFKLATDVNRFVYKNAGGTTYKVMHDATTSVNHPATRLLFTDANGAAESDSGLTWASNTLTAPTVTATVGVITSQVNARTAAGLRLTDDSGLLGLFVADSTGYVGVGTATPANTLDVERNQSTQARLKYDSTHYTDIGTGSDFSFNILTRGQYATVKPSTAATAMQLNLAETSGGDKVGTFLYTDSTRRANMFYKASTAELFIGTGTGDAGDVTINATNIIHDTKPTIFHELTASTANVATPVTLRRLSSGTTANGFGVAQSVTLQDGTGSGFTAGAVTTRIHDINTPFTPRCETMFTASEGQTMYLGRYGLGIGIQANDSYGGAAGGYVRVANGGASATAANYDIGSFEHYSTAASAARLSLRRSYSATVGTKTATVTGNIIGAVAFEGNGGSAWTAGALITAAQNGTQSTYTPTDLSFETYTGAAKNTDQMVLTTGGRVGIGTATPDTNSMLHLWNATAGSVAAPAGSLLTVENSDSAYVSVLVPDEKKGGLNVGCPDTADMGIFEFDCLTAKPYWRMWAGGVEVVNFDPTRIMSFPGNATIERASGGGDIKLTSAALTLSGGSTSEVTISSGHDLRLGQAWITGASNLTAYAKIPVKDSAGATYWVLAASTAG